MVYLISNWHNPGEQPKNSFCVDGKFYIEINTLEEFNQFTTNYKAGVMVKYVKEYDEYVIYITDYGSFGQRG